MRNAGSSNQSFCQEFAVVSIGSPAVMMINFLQKSIDPEKKVSKKLKVLIIERALHCITKLAKVIPRITRPMLTKMVRLKIN